MLFEETLNICRWTLWGGKMDNFSLLTKIAFSQYTWW